MFAIWKREQEKLKMTSEMKRTVLLCTDGGLHADYALKYYCKHVHKPWDVVIMLFCPKMIDEKKREMDVLVRKGDLAIHLGKLAHEEAARFQNDAKIIEKKIKENKLNGSVQIGVVGVPAGEVIVDTTKNERVDLIVLGARRLGSNLRKSTGSTKGYVIRNVNVPVLVCKHKKAQTASRKIRGRDVKRLVVAGSDGELHATEALKYFKEHMYRDGDYLLVVYIPVSRTKDSASSHPAITQAEDIGKEMAKLYRDDGDLLEEFIKDELKVPGEVFLDETDKAPGNAILEVANTRGADLIVVGSRGIGAAAAAAGPRTTDIIVNDSEMSVFMHRC
ncbi:uncharacterized protein LOC124128368 isoform X1 [Haliotis rufescens]|uniref:uncharacterized protein LOC124128368 isoform X1 n=2 Tax=Haliotis rufescens TaxID=6454 RepID=UPI001EB07C41|nr:uncharacterized protein LOC124128368 isoform X1 [Haliotis rufescens]